MGKKLTRPIGRAALLRVIDEVSLAGMARALNVRYQLIQGWTAASRRFATPAEYVPRVVAVARDAGLDVSESDLRPDVWQPEPAERAA